ncbi:hypothetical protein HPB50_026700 [Hyalomma asiaticum]|uniref:Uncharacterized protein n=1 Tax=Hyalomma asiaticum TaxID=266040 RepID=A0ACB7T2I4_HYAAI|nr:hypothetical protein HPB50_026700 [Hyalomma asiaticum]
MNGTPPHGPEQQAPATAEPAAEAPTVERTPEAPAAKPEAQPLAEDAPKQAVQDGKKRKRRLSRAQRHKIKQAMARRPSEQGDEVSRRSHQWSGAMLSEPRAGLSPPGEPTQPTSSDDRRQSMPDTRREENIAPNEPAVNPEAGRDEDISHTTRGRASRSWHQYRPGDHNPDTHGEGVSCMETRPALKCPPHQFSEIVATLHTAAHHEAGNKAPDRDQSLKYCVVVSLFVLLCLYYAGFLAAYALLSAQTPHRPPVSGRTAETHNTQWAFKLRPSREPERRNPHATTDARSATQEGSEMPPKSVPPSSKGRFAV